MAVRPLDLDGVVAHGLELEGADVRRDGGRIQDLPARALLDAAGAGALVAQVEGGDVDGLHVLLVDDLTTDGGSKLNFARGLRAAGAIVEHVLTIFYHDAFPGAAERLEQAGLTLHPLATWADILRSPAASRVSPQDRAEIERFLADPVAWSTRHGGRSKLSARS